MTSSLLTPRASLAPQSATRSSCQAAPSHVDQHANAAADELGIRGDGEAAAAAEMDRDLRNRRTFSSELTMLAASSMSP